MGTVPMVNMLNKPVTVVLSSSQATYRDASMSNVTFQLGQVLNTSDPNFAAELSLNYMSFYNTLKNITTLNNTFQILSIYTVNGTETYNIRTIVIPPDHYDVTTLIAYLNSNGICGSIGSDGYFYGIGNYGTADATAYPAFLLNPTSPSKMSINLPTAGTTGTLGTYNAAHVYRGFFLISNDQNDPFLDSIGYMSDATQDYLSYVTITWAGQQFNVIGNFCFNGGSGTKYTYTNPWAAPSGLVTKTVNANNVIGLGSPTALGININEVEGNSMVAYDNMSKGNTLATVPVSAPFSAKNVYIPANPAIAIIENFNVNTLSVKIRSVDTGELVDFQGSPWTLSIIIRFYEIENVTKSEAANTLSRSMTNPMFAGQQHQYVHTLHKSEKEKYLNRLKRNRIDNQNNNDDLYA
jgi:hypothetical protein